MLSKKSRQQIIQTNQLANMKYVIGSLFISFGILFVVVVVLMAMNVQAPQGVMKYLGLAWLVLAVVTYPVAKKMIRD